jgi:hypothetical protein
LRQQVEESEQTLYARRRFNDHHASTINGAANEAAERDAAKQVAELKLKLQEAERENTNNQGNVSIYVVSDLGNRRSATPAETTCRIWRNGSSPSLAQHI